MAIPLDGLSDARDNRDRRQVLERAIASYRTAAEVHALAAEFQAQWGRTELSHRARVRQAHARERCELAEEQLRHAQDNCV